MKLRVGVLIAAISTSCGMNTAVGKNEFEGRFDLASIEARSSAGTTVVFLPPQVSGSMSIESNGAYAFQVEFGGPFVAASGRCIASGGNVDFLDGQIGATFGRSTDSVSASYTEQTMTMAVSFSPSLGADYVALLHIRDIQIPTAIVRMTMSMERAMPDE